MTRRLRPAPADPTHPALRDGADALARLYARPGFLLRRAWQIATAVFESECVGITPAQYGTLIVLRAQPGIDQASLARALGYDKVTMLRVLRGLQARELVHRIEADGPRRRYALSLTEAGTALLGRMARPAARAGQRLLSPLAPAEQAQLVALLQKLTSGMEDAARARWVAPDANRRARQRASSPR
ncbi:MAG: MarR family winged helix-turn-helix transcriptional regulator [Burkholderiaceae bacterium]